MNSFPHLLAIVCLTSTLEAAGALRQPRGNAPAAARPAADPAYTVDQAVSKDGTTVGYRVYGRGPGVLIVQGAMGTAVNYDQLAQALATSFTVYVPDRRGRGLSPKPFAPGHAVARDVEDVSSVLEKTGTHFVFGLSSGAIIALEATRVLPAIQKTVLYEPPFYVDGVPTKKIARLNQELAEGRLTAAFVSIFKTTKVGPPVFNVLPRFILQPMAGAFLKAEVKKTPTAYTPIPTLIPTTRYDFQVVSERGGAVQSYQTVLQPVLLLGGSRSPAYLKKALATLARTVPNARRIELPGLDHSGPWNPDLGGQPATIAEEMRKFLQVNP